MAATKETLRAKDFTNSVKEITGLVRENYLDGLELSLSILEENRKALNSQVDQWFKFQQTYINAGRKLYEKFPKDIALFSNGNPVDSLIGLQKDYVDLIRKASEKFTKEAIDLSQKNIEKAFSLIN